MKMGQKRLHITLWEKLTESQQVPHRADGTAPPRGHRDNRAPREQVLVGSHLREVDTEFK